MRIAFTLVIIFIMHTDGRTQNTMKPEFIFGYGFYEGFNIGKAYYFKQGTQSASISIGYDKLMKQKNLAGTVSYNIGIFRSNLNKSDHFKWQVNNKVVLWQLEDKNYMWRALSLIPSINRRFSITRGLDISIDVGPSFNIVLYSKRKTFEEIGWPYHVMPDFRILIVL